MPGFVSKTSVRPCPAIGRARRLIAREYVIAAGGLIIASILAGTAMGDWAGPLLGRLAAGLLR